MPYFLLEEKAQELPQVVYKKHRSAKPQDIVLLIPTGLLQLQLPNAGITKGAFALTKTTAGDRTDSLYKLVIKVMHPSWEFEGDEPIRQTLKNDFCDFAIALEKNANLQREAIAIIQKSIIQYLPLTFEETLYYHYGFDISERYVDLQPGMRLRVEYQSYQFVNLTPDATQPHRNGFVANGTAYYEVCSYGENGSSIGFSPFLSLIQSTKVVPNRGGAGGIIDLLGVDYARPYYRLFYPEELLSSDDKGFTGTQKNVTLVGADNLEALKNATDAYQTKGNFDKVNQIVYAFFRGRAIVTPEITFFVNEQPTYVAVGTTIRQFISSYTILPRGKELERIQDERYGFSYRRSLDKTLQYKLPSLLNIDTNGNSSGYEPIFFNKNNYQMYQSGMDSFDLPILAGDALTFKTNGGF